jgi:hypothetical protein
MTITWATNIKSKSTRGSWRFREARTADTWGLLIFELS